MYKEKGEIVEILNNIGFSNVEAKIYLFLLGEKKARAIEIIKEFDLHKSTFYRAVDKLIKKGLVIKVKEGNKTLLKASNPKMLLGLLENLKWDIEKKLGKIERKEKVLIETYVGKVAVKNLLRRMLKEMEEGGRSYLDFGASGRFKEILPDFWDFWQSYKAKRRIKAKVIFTHEALEIKGLIKKYVGEMRFLPKEVASFTDTFIYNDVVVMFIWLEEPIAVYIKNEENANTYRNYFEVMWRFANKRTAP